MPRRPVLHGPGGTLLLVATRDARGAPTYHGVWLSRNGTRWVGPRPSAGLLSTGHRLDGITADLVNLVQTAARTSLERLETLSERLDALEATDTPAPLGDLAGLHRAYRSVREDVGRLSVVVAELEGPLGDRFARLAEVLPLLQAELQHLEGLAGGLGQSLRDVLALRSAVESNRLTEATNRFAEVSNQIAAYANTSNIRMLGVAYIALVLGLVSAVVLVPNTAATILGMPSAAWVPGLWVDGILAVLAVVPIVIVFSRPWVRRVLRGFRESESRTSEGVSDLPEVNPGEVNRPGEERLLDRPR